MIDLRDKLSLSTIADDAAEFARVYGLGLEIAEFCTAFNMDREFDTWDSRVRQEMNGVARFFFHAPFNELCPAAIDPLIADVAKMRFRQAHVLMQSYGINTMIVHSGYLPLLYSNDWFIAHSIKFWEELLYAEPDESKVYIENVFEQTPELLNEIVRGVNDERFKLCFDIGHAAISGNGMTITEWMEQVAPFLAHVHLHNNDGKHDTHNTLGGGISDIAAAIRKISKLAPEATFTIETTDVKSSISWLITNGFLLPAHILASENLRFYV